MTIADRAHAALAIISAVITAIAGSATLIGTLINSFGGHVSGMDITAKTTLASAGILTISKLIDSVNDFMKITRAS